MATIENKINDIKTSLLKLDIFSTGFGRAWKFRSVEKDRKVIVKPSILSSGNDLKIIQPTDEEKGLFFFYVKDKTKALNYDPAADNLYEAPTDIICWFNSNLFTKVVKDETVSTWPGLEECLSLVKEALKDFGSYRVDTITYEVDGIWSEFTLEEEKRQYFTHPFYGFRIGGTLTYLENQC